MPIDKHQDGIPNPFVSQAPHDIMFYWRLGAWTEAFQMFMTFILTLVFNIEVCPNDTYICSNSDLPHLYPQLGLAVSTFFSLVLVIQKSTQTRIKLITRLPGSDEWIPVDESPEGMESAEDDMPGVVSPPSIISLQGTDRVSIL